MGIERVGLRRLYDALGCKAGPSGELHLSFPILENRTGSVYLGATPPLGIMTLQSDQFLIPGKKSLMLHTDCEYQADCFLEIAVSFEVQVENSVSADLVRGDEKAKNALLDRVEPTKAIFSSLLDAIAGLVGLKFHKQFVLKPLIENSFISSAPEPVARFTGNWVETLEAISLTESGVDTLRSHLNGLSSVSTDTYEHAAKVLQWLLRAWKEHDPIDKFLYLFIPLECVLASAEVSDAETKQRISTLQEFVSMSDHKDKAVLLSFLGKVESKFGPTLVSRFESLAQSHKINGWEADISAFKKFNRTRNLLLHSGTADVRSHLDMGEETRTLEDLVERYVSLTLFGDPHVYYSKWRPGRKTAT